MNAKKKMTKEESENGNKNKQLVDATILRELFFDPFEMPKNSLFQAPYFLKYQK